MGNKSVGQKVWYEITQLLSVISVFTLTLLSLSFVLSDKGCTQYTYSGNGYYILLVGLFLGLMYFWSLVIENLEKRLKDGK